MATKERLPTIRTPEGIFSYPSLDIARKQDEDDPKEKAKFQLTLIFLPAAQLTPEYKEMQAQAIKAAQGAYPGKDVVAMFKDGSLRSPFRRDVAKKGYPEGAVFVNLRTTRRPQCIDAQGKVVVGEDLREQFYPGAIGRASVNTFVYDRVGNQGVSFGLGNVIKLRDGERLDSSTRAEDDFTADLSATPAAVDDLL